jgi:uncharacterized membrane protein YtjA (UPF0391 family)
LALHRLRPALRWCNAKAHGTLQPRCNLSSACSVSVWNVFLTNSALRWNKVEDAAFSWPPTREPVMLRYAIIFAVISVVAGFLGFGGISSASAGIAKIFFFIFIAVCILFFILAILGIKAFA